MLFTEPEIIRLISKIMSNEKLTKEEDEILKNIVYEKFKKYAKEFYDNQTQIEFILKTGLDN